MNTALAATIIKIAKPLAKKLGLKLWRKSYENAISRTAARNTADDHERMRDLRPGTDLGHRDGKAGMDQHGDTK